jgi:hypothetical protein
MAFSLIFHVATIHNGRSNRSEGMGQYINLDVNICIENEIHIEHGRVKIALQLQESVRIPDSSHLEKRIRQYTFFAKLSCQIWSYSLCFR